MKPTINRFRASILLGATGDTLGYHNGKWEFCYNTQQIRQEYYNEGGSTKMNVANLMVSDDTVLHLATIRALIKAHQKSTEEEIEIAKNEYVHSYYTDMVGRAPGTTTGQSMALLKKGLKPSFNLNHKTCGGAMRASAIGLVHHKEEELDQLIWKSIEYCRLTHNGPIAYMGSFLNALMTSYAINCVPVNQWIKKAIATKKAVFEYILSQTDGHKHIDYLEWIYDFLVCYQEFRFPDSIEQDDKQIEWDPEYPYFSENYADDHIHMDSVYDALSLEPDGHKSWAGSCGVSSVIISYDALLHAIYNNDLFNYDIHQAIYHKQETIKPEFYERAWVLTILAGMLHSGDNDSTGIIIGGWYGALFGARGVTKNLIKDLEYLDEMWQLAEQLHNIC